MAAHRQRQNTQRPIWMAAALGAIALGIAMAFTSVAAVSPQEPGSGTERDRTREDQAEQQFGVTTPGGIEGVHLRDIRWIEGEWEHVAASTFAEDRGTAPSAFALNIERTALGDYTTTFGDGAVIGFSNLTVFEHGCHLFAELRAHNAQIDRPAYIYATIEGHPERLSINLLPAVFPQAWQDRSLIDRLNIDADELPTSRRAEALAILAESIEEQGTLFHQDLTYYRMGWAD